MVFNFRVSRRLARLRAAVKRASPQSIEEPASGAARAQSPETIAMLARVPSAARP